jgi:GH15 family glucan-1,4-alpha-glucosidase
VLSKAACWAAVDLGVRLSKQLSRSAPVEQWEETRQEIRRTVEGKGYDKERGVFIQAFDRPVMDASLLLLPAFGFVDYVDKRMIRTTDAVWDDLAKDGYVRRYAAGNDSLDGAEGAFLACSFWMVECLARQGRFQRAKELFERTLTAGNDLYLFSEEYDPKTKEMLGNFPQGLTHLSLIAAAVTLSQPGRENT